MSKKLYVTVSLRCVENHDLLEKLRKLGCGVVESRGANSVVCCPTHRTKQIAVDILEGYGGSVESVDWEPLKLLKTPVDVLKLAGSSAFRRVL